MDYAKRRAALYWRALSSALGEAERREDLEGLAKGIAKDLGLPPLLLDPRPSIDDVLRRHPALQADFDTLIPAEDAPIDEASLRRALLVGKMLTNVFGAGVGASSISAGQYNQWVQDVGAFERAMGYAPNELRTGRGGASRSTGMPGQGLDTDATGVAPELHHDDVEEALAEMRAGRGLMSEPEIRASLGGMEKSLINRMALREVLKDKELAAKLTPSMALVEQLLRDKKNLQGPALANAKIIIRRFIDDLADVLKREVASAPKGRIDTSIPPKRTFRNLDLKRTIWKNLVNWNPEEGRLYVDQLYYKRTATLNNNTRLIVVVDQSGSMLSAMVNCTILASIFAGLPKVDAHLIAFDTQVLDLSPWVHDPFEVLLRTNLGGGNDGPKAMIVARDKIVDPRNTVMVWISDFYEFSNDRPLFQMIKEVVESGVQFIPVGSVSGSGYFNVNPWFRQQFKAANIPLMSGSLKTLITELKTALP
ncbi:MAG: VWA domain-containing protein [Alphaproteobacteria bacterium]|nr:VWA domain-containing protein [Alphaproteobacteria bacterium]